MDLNWNEKKIKEFIKPLIDENDIIRISYPPEYWRLNLLFDLKPLHNEYELITLTNN